MYYCHIVIHMEMQTLKALQGSNGILQTENVLAMIFKQLQMQMLIHFNSNARTSLCLSQT